VTSDEMGKLWFTVERYNGWCVEVKTVDSTIGSEGRALVANFGEAERHARQVAGFCNAAVLSQVQAARSAALEEAAEATEQEHDPSCCESLCVKRCPNYDLGETIRALKAQSEPEPPKLPHLCGGPSK
jgi:hypothetical protein